MAMAKKMMEIDEGTNKNKTAKQMEIKANRIAMREKAVRS